MSHWHQGIDKWVVLPICCLEGGERRFGFSSQSSFPRETGRHVWTEQNWILCAFTDAWEFNPAFCRVRMCQPVPSRNTVLSTELEGAMVWLSIMWIPMFPICWNFHCFHSKASLNPSLLLFALPLPFFLRNAPELWFRHGLDQSIV